VADWPNIVVRFALYATLMVLFGLPAFGLYGLRGEAHATSSRWWIVAAAALGAGLSLCAFDLMAASMAGVPALPVDREAFASLLATAPIGTAWGVRMAALGIAAIAASTVNRIPPRLAIVALASAVALSTLAWTGHGAMDEGANGWIHLGADIVHLIAASVWTGALLGLILLLARPSHRVDAAYLERSHQALHGFATVGTITVGALIASGIVNAWFLVGPANLASLGTTLYGQVLVGKLLLFTVMLCLAALNRFRLTPRFRLAIAANDHARALGALRLSLASESGCAILVLGAVAWLGTLAPPMSGM